MDVKSAFLNGVFEK
jgi:Reverse transcriptase (RNA-dependent DNA polymerase)